MKKIIITALLGAMMAGVSYGAGVGKEPEAQEWSFKGPVGTFDRGALRRGFKVYQEVCAACHSMTYLHYRNLSQAGGPEFSEAEVKAIASAYSVSDGPDDFGDMFERPALPRDKFVAPFANDNAAKAANGGALPPDLSLITKARAGGADYVYALLTGYGDDLGGGQYENPYMASGVIAMAPPLFDELVEYEDGTPMTAKQYAKDVTYFLAWAAEPEMESRKKIGVMSLIYLVIFAGLMFFSMRRVWREQH